MSKLNYILTIAGHDPCAGAGLTSDIKTFQAHGLYGLSVCTAVTVQNDVDFKECHWISLDDILTQIEVLLDRFSIEVVKIGLIENWENLSVIMEKLHHHKPNLSIILDPIIRASAGFDFHSKESLAFFDKVVSHCYVITPNYEEIVALYPDKSIEETVTHLSSLTNIYLKGGHRTDQKGWDTLYYHKLVQLNIPPLAQTVHDKHGSGCVLSASLASGLALGFSIEDAAFHAKKYTEAFLNSETGLLGLQSYLTLQQTQGFKN